MSFLAWPLIIAALCGMYPYARLLLRGDATPLLTALVTLALSFGALSLLAMWIGLLGLAIDWRLITTVYAAIVVLGWLILSRARRPVAAHSKGDSALLPRTWRAMGWTITIVTGIVAALIVFNAIYWPLGIDDALGIYGFYGKQIALSGHLPTLTSGALYEAYPMAVPLLYAYTHQAAGWIDEHLAALIPALLSVGVIGVAYLVGRELYDKATGLIAALLTALTPTIAFWSSASYVDLAAGFFYGLAILFAL